MFFQKNIIHPASPSFFDKLQTAHANRIRGSPTEPILKTSFFKSLFKKIKSAFKHSTRRWRPIPEGSHSSALGERETLLRLEKGPLFGQARHPTSNGITESFFAETLLIQGVLGDKKPSDGILEDGSEESSLEETPDPISLRHSTREIIQNLEISRISSGSVLPYPVPQCKIGLAVETIKSHFLARPNYGLPPKLTASPSPSSIFKIPSEKQWAPVPVLSEASPVQGTLELAVPQDSPRLKVVKSELYINLSNLAWFACKKGKPLTDLGNVEYLVKNQEFLENNSSTACGRKKRVHFLDVPEVTLFKVEDAPSGIFLSKVACKSTHGILTSRTQEVPLQQLRESVPKPDLTFSEADAKLDILIQQTRFPAIKNKSYKANVKRAISLLEEIFTFLAVDFAQPVVDKYLAYIRDFIAVGCKTSESFAAARAMAVQLECLILDHLEDANHEGGAQLYTFGKRLYTFTTAKEEIEKKMAGLTRTHKDQLTLYLKGQRQVNYLLEKANEAFNLFVRKHCRGFNDPLKLELSAVLGRDELIELASFFKNLNMGLVTAQLGHHCKDLGIAFSHLEKLLGEIEEVFIEVFQHVK